MTAHSLYLLPIDTGAGFCPILVSGKFRRSSRGHNVPEEGLEFARLTMRIVRSNMDKRSAFDWKAWV